MKANETPNERNYRLLKERFENESEFEIHHEIDYGNEPLKIKVTDPNGNENEHEIEKLTSNGFETTLHFKNENETGNENRNGNENELGNENENENRFENELHFRNELTFENETKNETQSHEEFIQAMKTEILFHTNIIGFQGTSEPQSAKKGYIRIVRITDDNIESLYQRYRETVKIYFDKEYLTTEEVEEFKTASQRFTMLSELYSQFRLKKRLDNMFDDDSKDDIVHADTSILQRASNYLHRIIK